jgi:hypothetical protein
MLVMAGDGLAMRMWKHTLEKAPPECTHWSTRSTAEVAAMSQSAVSRIWRAFSLQPHRVENFKLFSDPFFVFSRMDSELLRLVRGNIPRYQLKRPFIESCPPLAALNA